MVDRQTGSLWAQALGESIGGPLEGRKLEQVPAAIVSWGTWSAAHSNGLVLQAPASAPLDEPVVADSRDVGSAAAFVPSVGAIALTFDAAPAGPIDRETGSRWDIFGRAVSGPLEGERLGSIRSFDSFWFAWAAFRPDTRIVPTDDAGGATGA